MLAGNITLTAQTEIVCGLTYWRERSGCLYVGWSRVLMAVSPIMHLSPHRPSLTSAMWFARMHVCRVLAGPVWS
jgi:hypothetical protein